MPPCIIFNIGTPLSTVYQVKVNELPETRYNYPATFVDRDFSVEVRQENWTDSTLIRSVYVINVIDVNTNLAIAKFLLWDAYKKLTELMSRPSPADSDAVLCAIMPIIKEHLLCNPPILQAIEVGMLIGSDEKENEFKEAFEKVRTLFTK